METILLFTPLVGALVCGFGHKILGEKVATVFATALLFLTAALSWIVFLTFDPLRMKTAITPSKSCAGSSPVASTRPGSSALTV